MPGQDSSYNKSRRILYTSLAVNIILLCAVIINLINTAMVEKQCSTQAFNNIKNMQKRGTDILQRGMEQRMEPLNNNTVGFEKTIADERWTSDSTCGVEDLAHSQPDSVRLGNRGRSRRLRREASLDPSESAQHLSSVPDSLQYNIELHMVVDRLLFEALGEDMTRAKRHSADVISYTNALFLPLGIRVILKRVEVWHDHDRIEVLRNHSRTLSNFEAHRYRFLTSGKKSDVSVLLTNTDFYGTTVGYALVDTMCSLNAIATVHSDGSKPDSVAHTFAHEIGHVLGMNHDTEECLCSAAACVMKGSLSKNLPADIPWSDCSVDTLRVRLREGHFPCMDNVPQVDSYDRVVTCGDGVVEGTEQCDCGPLEFCENPCCDPLTCMFKDGASCASGNCCNLETCTILPSATLCRPKKNDCDLPEYCTGSSESCPVDVHVYTGATCDNGEGRCHKGVCGSSTQRCQTIFGLDSSVAQGRCFKRNVDGEAGRNCGRIQNSEVYKSCDSVSVSCGSIYCRREKETLRSKLKMTTWRIGDCYTAYFPNITMAPELELVPDGALCGTNKICLNQECVSVPSFRCTSDGCSGNGVCNSNDNCHCNRGYGPPYCATVGFGGSLDSGPSDNSDSVRMVNMILLLITVVVVPSVFVAIAALSTLNVWWQKSAKFDKRHKYRVIKTVCCCFLCKSQQISEIMENWAKLISNNKLEKYGNKRSKPIITNINVSRNVRITPIRSNEPSSFIHNSTRHTDIQIQAENSPLVHIRRPSLNQSISADSGCISETESHAEKKLTRPAPALPGNVSTYANNIQIATNGNVTSGLLSESDKLRMNIAASKKKIVLPNQFGKTMSFKKVNNHTIQKDFESKSSTKFRADVSVKKAIFPPDIKQVPNKNLPNSPFKLQENASEKIMKNKIKNSVASKKQENKPEIPKNLKRPMFPPNDNTSPGSNKNIHRLNVTTLNKFTQSSGSRSTTDHNETTAPGGHTPNSVKDLIKKLDKR